MRRPGGEQPRTRPSAAVRQRARELRRNPTPAEAVLWERLRGRRLRGLKFRRQHPLGRFIADFCCPEHRFVVELDGDVHQMLAERDQERSGQLEELGYRVLRFHNSEVEGNVEAVLEAIAGACG